MEEDINYEITPEICDEAITQEIYLQVGFKTSVCMLILNTGYEALGYYTPINIQDVNISIGKDKARKEAVRKATAHLSSISQWKKAVADIREAEDKRSKQEASKAPQEPT